MKKLFYLPVFACLLYSCGSSNASDEVVSDCTTETLSFSKDIFPIIEANCLECHSEENYAKKADGNKLYDYAAIKEKLEEGLILGNIKHETGFINMPYRKKKIDECDIAKIEAWVNAGAKND